MCSPVVPNLYFSGGDEKVIRVFESAQVVVDGLSKLCVDATDAPLPARAPPAGSARIQRAFIPALGLSNKAASLMNSSEMEEQESRGVDLMDWQEPPLEGQLSDHTLWPEMRKLFGHTNDVMCMSISHDGAILASACKGRNPETSSIILWSTATMSQIGLITAHESTVVCIRFSPSDRFIMSVSKDRGLCISERSDDGLYQPIILHKNAHKRIIWDCSWFSDAAIATGSRDGVCKVWDLGPQSADGSQSTELALVNLFEFRPFDGIAVTTLDVAPVRFIDGSSLLVTGSEGGDIKIWGISNVDSASRSEQGFQLLSSVDSAFCHGLTVKRIRWCPIAGGNDDAISSEDKLYFASCGEDKCVRVFSTQLLTQRS